jgi:hypothetical protein
MHFFLPPGKEVPLHQLWKAPGQRALRAPKYLKGMSLRTA